MARNERSVFGRIMPRAAMMAGAGSSPRPLVHPVVLAVDVDPNLPVSPLMAVRVSWEVHPALRSWVVAAGGQCDADTITLADVSLLDAALDSTSRKRMSSARAQGPRLKGAGRSFRAAGPTLPSTRACDLPLLLADHARVPVVGTDAWYRVAGTLSAAVVATVDPADPIRVLCGPVGDQLPVGPREAMAALERAHLTAMVAADDTSIDLAEMSLAAGADRPGLLARQDLAASQLRATQIGAVLAHPPGSGKTVIAAAALGDDPERTSLVLAPSAVLRQWRDEIAYWAPERSVRLAAKGVELPAGLERGDVLVTTWDLGAPWLAGDRSVDDVIVDEAAVLLGASRRTRSLWAARAHARRAWALSGTPRERHGDVDTAHLVAWARGVRPDAVPVRPAIELEPVVLLPDTSSGIPDLQLTIASVKPSTADHAWIASVKERVGEPTTAFEYARMGDLARRALGDRAALGESGPETKRDALVAHVSAHVRNGQSALVCSDSVSVASTVVDALRRQGVAAEVLGSDLSAGARTRLLAAFSNGDLPVLAVTPGSQRGVNLQRASLVAHADLPATLALFAQRNARAARMGSQHATVEVFVPFLEGTWDEQWVRQFLAGGTDPLSCR